MPTRDPNAETARFLEAEGVLRPSEHADWTPEQLEFQKMANRVRAELVIAMSSTQKEAAAMHPERPQFVKASQDLAEVRVLLRQYTAPPPFSEAALLFLRFEVGGVIIDQLRDQFAALIRRVENPLLHRLERDSIKTSIGNNCPWQTGVTQTPMFELLMNLGIDAGGIIRAVKSELFDQHGMDIADLERKVPPFYKREDLETIYRRFYDNMLALDEALKIGLEAETIDRTKIAHDFRVLIAHDLVMAERVLGQEFTRALLQCCESEKRKPVDAPLKDLGTIDFLRKILRVLFQFKKHQRFMVGEPSSVSGD